MAKILGLDLGTNSLGWAVVEESEGSFELKNKGVRIFQEGVKIEKGIEGSKAAERTGYRSARRLKFRRKIRKINTLRVLSDYGYCPKLSNEELNNWKTKKVYPQNEEFKKWWQTSEKDNKTPYYYRNLAVTKKLNIESESDRFKIGRSFYHIAQRRGFLSNRLEGTKESDGIVKKSIVEISTAKGDGTLGQYFYEKYLKGEKIRDAYTHREEHYLEEFEAIGEYQNLPEEFIKKLKQAIFFQRPLKSQKGLIGKCVFESNKHRCPVSRPEFEEYRMLCFINNIKIKTPDDEKLRFLTDAEKEKILPVFFRKSKVHFNFEDIAKKLAPKNQYKFYRNYNIYPEDYLFNYNMKTTVSACPVSARFKELFGDEFMSVKYEYIREKDGETSKIDINDIWHVLFSFNAERNLIEFAQNRLNLDAEQLKDFLKINLKQEYASLSLKAINKILPYLREGLIYSHAVFLANMENAVPKEIWNDEENKKNIRNEIHTIIKTQNEEKQIVEIVNGFMKIKRDETSRWSNEASEIFKKELIEKIKKFFGSNTYKAFSEEKKARIENSSFHLLSVQMKKNMGLGEFIKIPRIDDRIKTFIKDNFGVHEDDMEKLYHPSATEVYKPPVKAKDGRLYLGSPLVSSVKNPMAMRALHQLRKVINELIKDDIINSGTKIHIEMARDLMNANERKALQIWQRDREKLHKEYAERIKEYYQSVGSNVEPSQDEILKYQFWEEQNHKCVYTGLEISVSDFIGANPKYDIEHTIPRSLSFDNSQENKTLCESHFNRQTKRNKIPHELANHSEILARIDFWKNKYESLEKQIQQAVLQSRISADKNAKDRAIQKRHILSYERKYWQNKHYRFTMKDVPEGFKNSQLVDTGIITKYSRMYLKTLFDKVYTVKGNTVADLRKIWGLQDVYEKKARINHIHHCIDAITIACMTKKNYEKMAKFYHDWEEAEIAGIDSKPRIKKPWDSFAEDVKNIEKEVLISHYTPDVLPKQSKKKLRKRGKIQYNKNGEVIYQQGDSTRGSLHKETFYGAIERSIPNKKGELEKQIKYVVRKSLDILKDSDIKNIVDDRVREIISNGRINEKQFKKEIETLDKKLRMAEEYEEAVIKQEIQECKDKISGLYSLPNKNGQAVPIKKVRIYTPTVTNPIHLKKQRDKSEKNSKSYKESYHVSNDGNYLMAIYEGKDANGKIKRDFEIVNNLKAGEYFKLSVQKVLKPQNIDKLEGLVPKTKTAGEIELTLKGIIKTGTMVILWENNPEEVWELDQENIRKRLYKITGLSMQRIVRPSGKIDIYATIVMLFHQEASPSSDLKTLDGNFSVDEEYKAQRKMNHNQFKALIEGVDFKLTLLGEVTPIK